MNASFDSSIVSSHNFTGRAFRFRLLFARRSLYRWPLRASSPRDLVGRKGAEERCSSSLKHGMPKNKRVHWELIEYHSLKSPESTVSVSGELYRKQGRLNGQRPIQHSPSNKPSKETRKFRSTHPLFQHLFRKQLWYHTKAFAILTPVNGIFVARCFNDFGKDGGKAVGGESRFLY